MPIIGYSPWQDAERFGQGVGQSLSQGLMQLPQERYRMALQQAQLRQAEQYRQQQLGIAQQQANQTGLYQQGNLEETKRYDTMMGQNQDIKNTLAEQNLQLRQQLGEHADQIRQLTAMINGLKAGAVTMGQPDAGGSQPTNNLGMPPGFNLTTPPPMNPNQAGRLDLGNKNLMAGLMSLPGADTNAAIQRLILAASNNAAYYNGLRPGMSNAVPQQPIQQGSNSVLNPNLRQRPDGTLDFIP